MGVAPCPRNQCPVHVPGLWHVQPLEVWHLVEGSTENYSLVMASIISRRVAQDRLDGERFERSKAPVPHFYNTMG
jgi:hypothetical protein